MAISELYAHCSSVLPDFHSQAIYSATVLASVTMLCVPFGILLSPRIVGRDAYKLIDLAGRVLRRAAVPTSGGSIESGHEEVVRL